MAEHWQILLGQVLVADPTQSIEKLPLLTEKERLCLLNEWNNTRTLYSGDLSIPQLFSEQAERYADTIAAIFEEKSLTYRELDRRANQTLRTIYSSMVFSQVSAQES